MNDLKFTECIRKIQSGDRQGLEDIYSEYYKLIYSAALAVTGNRTDAEDAVSDYFVKLWLGISGGKITFDASKTGHRRWLAVTANNLALDNMRKAHRSESPEELSEEDAPTENPEESLIEQVRVKEALDSLDENEREVVHLKHFGGFTLKEISEILSVPQGTAAWRYRTAAEKLRKLLGEAF